MTYLEIVNEVLDMLREDEVSSVSDTDYSKLIGKFVKRAKNKVEDAWEWSRLRSTIRITTVGGSYSYSLTGAGKKAKILRDPFDRPDVFNDTLNTFLNQAPSSYWMSSQLNYNPQTDNVPEWFDLNGYDTNYDPIVDLYPIPDTVYIINFNLYIPQSDLSSDTDVLIVPDEPVILYTYMYAIRERGEDGGTRYAEEQMDAQRALGDAIALDAGHNPDQLVWFNE